MTTKTRFPIEHKHREAIEWLAARETECKSRHFAPVQARYWEIKHPESPPCNGIGRVPLFPMLRYTCQCNPLWSKEITGCEGNSWHPIYTAAPFDALLGRIRELGLVVGMQESGDWSVCRRGVPQTYYREGTDYQRFIAALYHAMKAMEEVKG